MAAQTTGEAFAGAVACMLKDHVFPSISEFYKDKHGVHVSVEELATILNLPSNVPSVDLPASVAGRRVITKKHTSDPERKCIFPSLRGKSKEEGKKCGKRLALSKNEYFCTSCINKPSFKIHINDILTEIGKTWKEVMGDAPEPKQPETSTKRKGKTAKVKAEIPVRNPGIIAPEPEEPSMIKISDDIYLLNDKIVIYCEDVDVDEPNYIAIGTWENKKIIQLTEEHTKEAQEMEITLGDYEEYADFYDIINNPNKSDNTETEIVEDTPDEEEKNTEEEVPVIEKVDEVSVKEAEDAPIVEEPIEETAKEEVIVDVPKEEKIEVISDVPKHKKVSLVVEEKNVEAVEVNKEPKLVEKITKPTADAVVRRRPLPSRRPKN